MPYGHVSSIDLDALKQLVGAENVRCCIATLVTSITMAKEQIEEEAEKEKPDTEIIYLHAHQLKSSAELVNLLFLAKQSVRVLSAVREKRLKRQELLDFCLVLNHAKGELNNFLFATKQAK